MYTLSEKQIDFILNDIKIRGVEMEDLQLNLLDHICCIIECELEQEGDFEDFYHKTIPKFFKKELKEIEAETQLLLTFKNYYAMKKTMNAVGIIASISIVLGAIFKFQHWAGASVLLLCGVVLISFIFLPLMFTLKFRELTEKRDRTLLILACIISILLVVATEFKIMSWPGGAQLMTASILSLLFLFVPIYLFTGLRNPATKVNTLINSILIIAGSGLLMSLSLKANYSIGGVNGIIGVHQRLLKNTEMAGMENKAIYNSIQNKLPADVKMYFVESAATQEYLKRLKIDLIMFAEGVPVEEAEKLTINFIHSIGNEDVPMFFMLGPNRTGVGEGNAEELKEKLNALSNSLSKLQDSSKNKWGLNVSNDNINFDHVSMGFVLLEFVELQYEIVNTNSQILNYYSAKL